METADGEDGMANGGLGVTEVRYQFLPQSRGDSVAEDGWGGKVAIEVKCALLPRAAGPVGKGRDCRAQARNAVVGTGTATIAAPRLR